MRQFKSRKVLLDASSSILLYKAEIIERYLACFQAVLSETVFHELTCNNHAGAEDFYQYYKEKRFTVTDTPAEPLSDMPLTGGERDLVLLYKSGCGDYLVLDDKKAAVYCRDAGIPFINALLVPRILRHAGHISDASCDYTTAVLTGYGRYAPWVISFAQKCSVDDLKKYF